MTTYLEITENINNNDIIKDQFKTASFVTTKITAEIVGE